MSPERLRMEKSRNQTGRLRGIFRRKNGTVTLTVPEKDGILTGPPELKITDMIMNEVQRRMREDTEGVERAMVQWQVARDAFQDRLYYTPTGYYTQQAARVG